MITSGISNINPAEMKVETTSTNPLEAGPGDFSSFLREMQNRGMAQLQLSLLPGGKLKESMEEVKNINFDLLELPKEVKKAEESNVLSFKNESLEELEGEKAKPKLESSELFLSQREISKTAGKNQGINTFSKIFNVKKEAADKPEAENILSLMEGKKDLGEISKSEAPKAETVKFGNTKQLFNWISKIIAKNSVTQGQSLNLAIRDGSLGQFNIVAQNLGGNGQLNMQIVTQSEEGKNFFQANEKGLVKALESAGLKVSEFRVQLAGTGNSVNNDLVNLISDSREAVAERFEQNMFEREDFDQDSRRRQRIWNEMKENRSKGA